MQQNKKDDTLHPITAILFFCLVSFLMCLCDNFSDNPDNNVHMNKQSSDYQINLEKNGKCDSVTIYDNSRKVGKVNVKNIDSLIISDNQ